jgi:hemerythrin-like metal-binding protein
MHANIHPEQLLHWSPALSVGNADLDAQHIILLEIGRDLLELLHEGRASQQHLWSLLNDFLVISSHHDALEESILADNHCPSLPEHRAAHTRAREHIQTALLEAQAHCLHQEHLRHALMDWMNHHLSEMDLKVKQFLRYHPQRSRPPEAALANDMALSA